MATTITRKRSALPPSSPKRLHFRDTGCPRPLHVRGHFVEIRPHIDNKKSNKDVDDSSDLYDTIEWLLKNIPNNNGKAGIGASPIPDFSPRPA